MLRPSKFFFGSHKKQIRLAMQTLNHPLIPVDVIGKDIGTKMKDRGDAHIKLMPKAKVEKIGSKSLLDKQWNDKPMQVIKSPDKLTEVELLLTLQKIAELPDKRFKQLIKENNQDAVNDILMKNVVSRMQQFLTSTLVSFLLHF